MCYLQWNGLGVEVAILGGFLPCLVNHLMEGGMT